MSTTIFYFTGTGNSLMVSRDISKGLGDTKLVSIAQAINESEIQITDDCIGFVFPVYNVSFPVIVRDFVKSCHLINQNIFLQSVFLGPGLLIQA